MDCLRSARREGYEDLDAVQPENDANPQSVPQHSARAGSPTSATSSPPVNTSASKENPAASRVILKAGARRSSSNSSFTPPPYTNFDAPPAYDEAAQLPPHVNDNNNNNARHTHGVEATGATAPEAGQTSARPSGGQTVGAVGAGLPIVPRRSNGGHRHPADVLCSPVVDTAPIPGRKKRDGSANRPPAVTMTRTIEEIQKTENLLRDGKNVLCPICHGVGKIPKEEENHRVALIAADDERLKPSKTKYYVFAAIVLTVTIAGLMMFFLYPRSFTITQKIGRDYCGPKLYPYFLTIDVPGKIVHLKVTDYWELNNPNYYPIQLVSLNVQAYKEKLLTETSNSTSVSVSLRTSGTIYMDLNITIEGDLGLLVIFCADHRDWVHNILIRTQVTAVVTVMGYNFTSISETYQKVSCGYDEVSTTPSTHVTRNASKLL